MQESECHKLIHHMEWADAQIWTCILNLPSLERDEWIKERMHHYHSTQWAYGQILLRLPIVIPDLNNFPDATSIGLWARKFYKELFPKVVGLSKTELQQTVEFPWSAQVADRLGSVSPANAGESLMQLALHSAHHRGQVAMRVREAGGKPPTTDFIAWIWMGRPEARWGMLAEG